MHIIDSHKCNCGFEKEDVHHFFLTCPFYVQQRTLLLDVYIQYDINLSINTLLYGDPSQPYAVNLLLFNAFMIILKRALDFHVNLLMVI